MRSVPSVETSEVLRQQLRLFPEKPEVVPGRDLRRGHTHHSADLHVHGGANRDGEFFGAGFQCGASFDSRRASLQRVSYGDSAFLQSP